MMIIHASSDLHPPSQPHQMITQQPIVKQPLPNHKMSLPPNLDQIDATGSARGSPATAVVPSNHATPT